MRKQAQGQNPDKDEAEPLHSRLLGRLEELRAHLRGRPGDNSVDEAHCLASRTQYLARAFRLVLQAGIGEGRVRDGISNAAPRVRAIERSDHAQGIAPDAFRAEYIGELPCAARAGFRRTYLSSTSRSGRSLVSADGV